MINLNSYTIDLVERDGILYSKNESKISYPESGNENCFQVEENSFWFRHRNNCIIETVKKYSPSSLFFDIGGGNGFVAKALEESGIQTVLIEPGIQGCLNAKKRNLSNIICSTFEDAAFKKNTINSAGLFDVVEHIEDDVAFLKSINYYMNENGFIFITVPAFKFLWSNEDTDAGHYKRYTIKSIENTLKSAGFQIKYSTYIFSILPLPVFLFRTLPSRMGFYKNSNTVEQYKKDHESKSGFLHRALNKIWDFELNKIKRGEKIPFGGSCFVVAQKVQNV